MSESFRKNVVAKRYIIVQDSCRPDEELGRVCKAFDNNKEEEGKKGNVTLFLLHEWCQQLSKENKKKLRDSFTAAYEYTQSDNTIAAGTDTLEVSRLLRIEDIRIFSSNKERKATTERGEEVSFVVMEWLEQIKIENLVLDQLHCKPGAAIRFVQELANSIATIYARQSDNQYLHRPKVKLENILVRPESHQGNGLVLSDWGFITAITKPPNENYQKEDVYALATILIQLLDAIYETERLLKDAKHVELTIAGLGRDTQTVKEKYAGESNTLWTTLARARNEKTEADDASNQPFLTVKEFAASLQEYGSPDESDPLVKQLQILFPKVNGRNEEQVSAVRTQSSSPINSEQTDEEQQSEDEPTNVEHFLATREQDHIEIQSTLELDERYTQALPRITYQSTNRKTETYLIGSKVPSELFTSEPVDKWASVPSLRGRRIYLQRHYAAHGDDAYYYTVSEQSRFVSGQTIRINDIPISPYYSALLPQSLRLQIDNLYSVALERVPKYPESGWSLALSEQQKALVLRNEHHYFKPSPTDTEVVIPLTVYNRTNEVDQITIVVDGMPIDWPIPDPIPLNLFATADVSTNKQNVELVVRLPATRLEGSYNLYVRAISTNVEAQVDAIHLRVIIEPQFDFTGRLHPEVAKIGSFAEICIENRGNVEQEFLVECRDRAGELRFQPNNLRVQIAPNHVGYVGYKAFARGWRLLGRENRHEVNVTVTSQNSQLSQTYSGHALSKALIPRWVPLLLGILLLGFVLIYSLLFPPTFESRSILVNRALAQNAIAGQENLLQWNPAYACFYSVFENDNVAIPLRLLRQTSAQFPISKTEVGDRTEVRLRSCALLRTQSWTVNVVPAAPVAPMAQSNEAPLTLLVKNVEAEVIGRGGGNATEGQPKPLALLIGQTGDFCVQWGALSGYDQNAYGLRISVQPDLPILSSLMSIREPSGEQCFSIMQTLRNANTHTVTLSAIDLQSNETVQLHREELIITKPKCQVNTGNVPLYIRQGPGRGYPEVGQLAGDEVVFPLARPLRPREQTDDDDWVPIALLDDPRPVWVAYQYLWCPIDIYALPAPDEIPVTPTPTPSETPTHTPVPTVTKTPTPTATPVPPPEVSVEPEIINLGGCFKLKWSVVNVRAVYLDDEGVAGVAEMDKCPVEHGTYEYSWRIVRFDDSISIINKTVVVNP